MFDALRHNWHQWNREVGPPWSLVRRLCGWRAGLPHTEMSRLWGLLLLPFLLGSPSTLHALAPECVGDCDGDSEVQISELVRAVNIALSGAGIDRCALADANQDGTVAINELVIAVNNALLGCARTPAWFFAEVGQDEGARYDHVVDPEMGDDPAARIAAAAAAGDYDGDGYIDLYVAAGDATAGPLLRNQGDGRFSAQNADIGLPTLPLRGAAYAFADIDGDDTLDLFVAGVGTFRPRIFGGRTDGTFDEETSANNFAAIDRETFDTAFADFDRDGDLDLGLAHWGSPRADGEPVEHLYRNDGDWGFEPVGIALGVVGFDAGELAGDSDLTFAVDFADLDDDGWQDLVFAADDGGSQVFLNDGSGAFVRTTDSVITGESGKGSALGDYDNDGDIDWFVSGTWDPNGVAEGNWGVSGNRLFENRGDGTFEDATDRAGVREGFWGWGSCFADFNNDGHLDLFQVNGFSPAESDEFTQDPSRLFLSNGDGSFTERSQELGLVDRSQGRTVACFDYDRDGDIDVFIAANDQPSQLWRNEGGNTRGHYLAIRLAGRAPNTRGVGARITVVTNDRSQIREISNNPAEVHFGLDSATAVDLIRVRWPRGEISELENVDADQMLVLPQP